MMASETPDKGYVHSRLALLQEGGGKTRTIAIGDYWSQNVLRPLHDCLMGVLKRLETDGTYDQDDQFERISRLASHESHSFDLTSATDRFPIKLQEIVLSCMFGEKLSTAWVAVMTQRDYHYQDKTVR